MHVISLLSEPPKGTGVMFGLVGVGFGFVADGILDDAELPPSYNGLNVDVLWWAINTVFKLLLLLPLLCSCKTV